MDKQELLSTLRNHINKEKEKIENADSDTWISGYGMGRVDALTFGYEKVEQLDELEKPEIPAELAKKIENFKGKVNDDYIIYSIFLDDEYDNLNKDTHQWIKDNPGKLSRAVVNGYTIQKEPAWVVKINEKVYFCRFTDKYFEKDSDTPTYIESGNPSLIKKITNKDKAEAVAILVDGTVEEWSE